MKKDSLAEEAPKFEPFLIEKENDLGKSLNIQSINSGENNRNKSQEKKHMFKANKNIRTRSPAISDEIPIPSPLMASAEAESLHPLVQSLATKPVPSTF